MSVTTPAITTQTHKTNTSSLLRLKTSQQHIFVASSQDISSLYPIMSWSPFSLFGGKSEEPESPPRRHNVYSRVEGVVFVKVPNDNAEGFEEPVNLSSLIQDASLQELCMALPTQTISFVLGPGGVATMKEELRRRSGGDALARTLLAQLEKTAANDGNSNKRPRTSTRSSRCKYDLTWTPSANDMINRGSTVFSTNQLSSAGFARQKGWDSITQGVTFVSQNSSDSALEEVQHVSTFLRDFLKSQAHYCPPVAAVLLERYVEQHNQTHRGFTTQEKDVVVNIAKQIQAKASGITKTRLQYSINKEEDHVDD